MTLIVFLITAIDSPRSFRMTFNVSLTTTANPLLLLRMTPNGKYASAFNSQLTANSSQLIAFIFLPFPSPRQQILRYRFRMTSYGLRHRFGVTLIVSRHSERWQECFVGKTGSGTMTQSEESMILMTSYRFPHYRYRSFTSASDDV